MKCQNCQHKNPEEAKFCIACGSNLFFGNESDRHDPSLDRKLEKIQRYLPRGITAKIQSDKDKIEGERKQVTVMFCDMVGFTPLVEKIGPEKAYTLMDLIYEILIHNVHDYDGIVNEFTGDGIMALFGVPTALENAPQWALRSALSIHREISKFNEDKDTILKMRIGVNTGPVILGSLGNDLRVEFKAVGDTVNLASRIEGLAEPGSTYVSEHTFKLTEDLFRFESIGKKWVKGKKQAVFLYKLLTAKKDVYRPRLGSERMIFSEMVGRERELDKLELQVMKAVNGQGSIVNIIGEAGIGKSRLVAELKNREVITRVTLLEGRSISIGRNLPFHPIVDMLKQWARIQDNDSDKRTVEKVETAVRKLCSHDLDEVFPFVATLMGIKLSGRHAARVRGIEGEALEKLILKNLRDLLIRASESTPLVIVTEDLHWTDTSSLELLLSLFRLAATHKILFINVFRPGHKDTGQRVLELSTDTLTDHCITIHLHPLNGKMSEALVYNMLKLKGSHHRVIDQIVQRADGNPFFIEEVVRSLIDEGAIVIKDGTFRVTQKIEKMVVPYTINDVLMARIDRLEERTRDLIKVASVIGRNFFYRILSEVIETIEDIDDRLVYLKEIQLIREQKRMDEIEYLFKHALAQESAYESILPFKRAKLHEKVADSIETVFKDRIHQFYGMLAFHYSKGENENKAEQYLIKAGEEALRSSASSEAIHYYREALNFYLKNYGDAADQDKVAMLERNIAIALSNKGQYVEALEYIEKTLASIGVHRSKHWFIFSCITSFSFIKLLMGLYIPFLRFRKIPNDRDRKILDLEIRKCEAITISDPKRFFCETLNLIGSLSKFKLETIEKGSGFFVGSAVIFNWTGISFGLSRKILNLCEDRIDSKDMLSRLYFETILLMHNFLAGDWSSIKTYRNSLAKVAVEKGQSLILSVYVVWYGLYYIEKGRFGDAHQMIEKLAEISDVFEQDYAKILHYQLNSRLLVKTRKLQRAAAMLDEGIKFLKKTNNKMYLNDFFTMKAQTQILLKDFDVAESSLMSANSYLEGVEPIPYFHTPFIMAKCALALYRMETELEAQKKADLSGFKKRVLALSRKASKISKKTAYSRTEAFKLMGTCCWIVDKQGQALRWWSKSITAGKQIGTRLELSRTYFEVGKRLSEPKTRYNRLKGIHAEEYLKIAKEMFTEMNLQWDLDELERIAAYK